METARKGMWNASKQQLDDIASLHARLVDEYMPSCSQTVCDNLPLRNFIASYVPENVAGKYLSDIDDIREAEVSGKDGVVMKREVLQDGSPDRTTAISNAVLTLLALAAVAAIMLLVRRRRRKSGE